MASYTVENKVTKQQKRSRVPLSCSCCRKKKIKCDRRKPYCKVCEAHKLPFCEYLNTNGEISRAVIPYEDNEHPVLEDNINIINTGNFSNADTDNNTNDRLKNEILALKSHIAYLENSLNNQKNSNLELRNIQTGQIKVNDQNQITDKNQCQEPQKHIQNDPQLHSQNLNMPSTNLPNSFNPLPKFTASYDPYTYQYTEISKVRQLIQSLKINNFDRIKIFDGLFRNKDLFLSKSRLNNFGPFSWVTLILKDPYMISICDSVYQNNKQAVAIFQTKKNSNALIDSGFEPEIGNLNNDNNPTIEELLKNIAEILPSKKYIWLFIDRFFNFVYPFVPIVDHDCFTKSVEKLLGGDKDVDINMDVFVKQIKIMQDTDLAILGTLLIIIKFAYNSLFTNNGKTINPSDVSENELLSIEYSNNEKLIVYAQSCLNEFKLLRKCPLVVLQCAVLLKEYQKFDGSDGFVEGDSQIYTGLLVQMAVALGLNRDPKKIDERLDNNTHGLLWRKIWYVLIAADNYQYMQSGTPPVIYTNHYDTNLPVYNENVSNNNNKELELVTIELMTERFCIERKMRDIADLISNIHESPIIEELLMKIVSLTNELTARYGSMKAVLEKDHEGKHYKKVKKAGQWMIICHSMALLYPVLLYVFYHYQSTSQFDASFFFFNKILSILMPLISNNREIILSGDIFFGYGFDLFLVPLVEICMHKSLIFFVSTYAKIMIWKEKLERYEVTNHNQKDLLEAIEALRLKICGVLSSSNLVPLKALAKRYFYSWRILKVNTYIVKIFREEEIKFNEEYELFNFTEYLTVANVKMMTHLIDSTYYKAGNTAPGWLQDWLQHYDNYSYYGPGNTPVSKSNICENLPYEKKRYSELYGNAGTYADDIWINKIKQHFGAIHPNDVDTSSNVSNPLNMISNINTANQHTENNTNILNENNHYSGQGNNGISNNNNNTNGNDIMNDESLRLLFTGFNTNEIEFDNMFWYN